MQAITPIWTACIIVGLLMTAPGCSDDTPTGAEFIQEQTLEERIAAQAEIAPTTIDLLRKEGISANEVIRLDFYFYTNDTSNAAGLAEALEALNYKVQTGKAPGPSGLQMVKGSTIPMPTDQRTVIAWTEKMCRLGDEHNSAFDGWTASLSN